jgi:hypothetical protein
LHLKNDHFTKTGSGQTQAKVRGKAFSTGSSTTGRLGLGYELARDDRRERVRTRKERDLQMLRLHALDGGQVLHEHVGAAGQMQTPELALRLSEHCPIPKLSVVAARACLPPLSSFFNSFAAGTWS